MDSHEKSVLILQGSLMELLSHNTVPNVFLGPPMRKFAGHGLTITPQWVFKCSFISVYIFLKVTNQ